MRRYAISIVASVAVLAGVAAALVTTGSSTDAAADPSVVVRMYSYGDQATQNLDVHLPPALAAAPDGSALTPTVLLVHGGGWTGGDKAAMAKVARRLVNQGFVAVAVNYRLAPESPWPAQRTDLRRAIRWVRDNAGMLHVDTNRIVVLGSSAGGEIAASTLAVGRGSTLARGLITLSAPLDLELVAADTPGTPASARLAEVVSRDLLRCLPDVCAARAATSSAVAQLDPSDTPSLLFTSADEWVDPASSRAYRDAARAQGLLSRLVVLDGDRHSLSYWKDVWPTIRRWIAARTAG